MAVNRLAAWFSPEKPKPETSNRQGFLAVPVAGIPGWNELPPGVTGLYDFALLLAQMEKQGDPGVANRWLGR